MDSYKEQIVKIKPTATAFVCKGLMWLLAVLIAFGCFFAALKLNFPFIILLAAAVVYCAYKVNAMLNIEYEYIATNSTLDIDKIINKSSRKRIVSFDCTKVEKVTKYTGNYKKQANIKAFTCTDCLDAAYVFSVVTKEFGKCDVIFSPDDEFIKHIRMFVPRSLISEWWK